MTTIPQRIGNYRIDKPIGRGGSSQVLLGRHLTLEGRVVAIKLLLSHDDDSIERFLREANIASRLRHPNIVQVYDHGFQTPFYYAVMEFVDGGALRALIQSRALPIEQVRHVFMSIGQALDYAHANGVVHRDVSPGNILLEPATNRVLLTDFGIAREAGKAGVTSVGHIMGTPGYLSPEHAMSATAVTHLSDIFGLGVVLFELLSGSLPWDHNPGMPPDSNGGAFTPPKQLRERGVELPSDIDRVIQTMLALDPAKRYPTAQAAVDDFERVMSRHTSPTFVVGSVPTSPMLAPTGRRTKLPGLTIAEPEPHAIERALALDLLKGPLQESRRHAEAMSDSYEIANLLDHWAAGGILRIRALGRQANLRRVQTTNVYFYTLKVLFETRSPAAEIEEPDYKAAQIKLEKEIDRWGVKLPEPTAFKAESGGSVRLPGSMRVAACTTCKEVGRTVCPRCQGRGRITRPADVAPAGTKPAGASAATGPRAAGSGPQLTPSLAGSPAATLPGMAASTPGLIACPECSGSGALRCKRCDGVGRVLLHKTTTWSRSTKSYESHDDLPRIDESALSQSCRKREVYHEQARDGFRPEWQHVPAIVDLMRAAQTGLTSDVRVVLSELQISFIPVTEVVFDLDATPQPAPPAGSSAKVKPVRQGEIYSRYIFGFERYIPKDWTLLNWERVWVFILATSLVVALCLIIVLLVRMRLFG